MAIIANWLGTLLRRGNFVRSCYHLLKVLIRKKGKLSDKVMERSWVLKEPPFLTSFYLYGFDFTRDFVINAQHCLPLGVVKHNIHLMIDEEKAVDPMNATCAQKLKILSEKLALFP